MENYLAELLKENNRVIVPNFGAFIVRQQDPTEIAFNSLLNFNDGMLIEHVIKCEDISYNEAAAKVEEFSNKMVSGLESEKELTINEIGKITVGESGEKTFIQWREIEEEAEAKEEEEEEEEKVTEDEPEVEMEAESEVETEAESEVETETESEVETEAEPELETEAEPEVETETGTEKQAKAEAKEEEEKVTEDEPEVEMEAESEVETEAGTEKQAKAEAEVKEEEEIEAKPENEVKPETQVKAEIDKEIGTEKEPVKNKESEPEPVKVPETAFPGQDIIKDSVEEPAGFILDDTLTEVDVDATKETEGQPQAEKTLAEENGAAEPFTLDQDELITDKTIDSETRVFTGTPQPTTKHTDIEPDEPYESYKPDKPDKPDEPYKPDEPDEPYKPYKPYKREMAYHPAPEKQTGKKRRWIIPVGIAALLVLIIAAGWFLFPEKARQIMYRVGISSVKPDVSSEDLSSLLDEETTETLEPGETLIEESAPFDQQSQSVVSETIHEKRYYVVAGCFANRENAEKFVNELRKKGYNASIFGVRKNLNAVCFDSFGTKSEALRQMRLIRQQAEPEAWVLYY